MKIDVASAISELLFEHESIVIPALGGFTTSYKPSTIDYVQGNLNPPSKELRFNENLMINDGILVNYLQEKYQLSVDESEVAIQNFVKDILGNLAKKEMVVIPQVGRLYKDYEDKVKFLPETTNFNTQSFGLPNVQFYPVVRDKGANSNNKQKNKSSSKRTQKAEDSELPGWMKILLPILGILSIIVIGLGIYIYGSGSDHSNTITNLEVNEERLNKKPGDKENVTALDDDEDLEDLKMDEAVGENEGEDPAAIRDTEAPTLNPNQKTAFVVMHSLKNTRNAEKFLERLNKAGYASHSIKENGLHKVGVLKTYEDRKELEELVEQLYKEFNTRPVILEGDF